MHWIAGNSKVDEALSTDSSSIMSSPVPIALRMPSRMMILGVTTESLIWLRVSVTDVWESGETTQGFPPHRCCSRPKEGHNDYPYRQTPHLETNLNGVFSVQQEILLEPTTSTHVNCDCVLGSQKGHIHPDSRKLILKYDDTIGYQSVGKSHEKSFSRSNSSLYTFVFYSCFEVSHSSGWATEETTAILVNFRISHQRLATVSFPTCLTGISNMWCNIQRILQK